MSRHRVVATTGFKRDVQGRSRRDRATLSVIEEIISVLEEDPFNISRRFDIKKLHGIRPGEGQWRIRTGNFRLRYDVIGKDVVLYSFRDRKEAY